MKTLRSYSINHPILIGGGFVAPDVGMADSAADIDGLPNENLFAGEVVCEYIACIEG